MTRDVDKSRIANATTEADEHGEIAITPEMIEAGEGIILGELGGLDLPGFLSAREMATQVYQAMRRLAQANP